MAKKKQEIKEYHFDKSAYHFLGMMKWTLVVRKVAEEQPEGWEEAFSNPEVNEKFAQQYGITDYILIKELIRLAKELEDTTQYNLYKLDEINDRNID